MSNEPGRPKLVPLATAGAGRPWAGDPPHVAAARERLLEATARCIAREGIASTTVAAIAAEAGVSRQTVYRYFKDRDAVVLRTIRAAAESVRAKIERQIGALADPADMIVEALVIGLAELRSDPVLRRLLDPAGLDASVASLITQRPGIEWTRRALGPAVDAVGWSEEETDSALELVLRLFLSLIISPSPERTSDELRCFLHRHLVPGLRLGTGDTP